MEMKTEEKKKPEISILMCVYNPTEETQLRAAVCSMIQQTFSDWEMLLYDDGSDAVHQQMIQKAASMDPRIRYIRSEKNHGLAYGLNVCLEQTNGRYIARMDADDRSKPERLQKMYDFLEEHTEYGWVGSNTALFDKTEVYGRREMPEVPKATDFLKYSPYIHPSVVFRKSVLFCGGKYKNLHRGEDYELFMRLHAQGYQGYNLQELLFEYREDQNTYKHRKYCYQIEEVKIRLCGFKRMHILNVTTFYYVIKPLLTGLVPDRILMKLKPHVRKEMYVERYAESKS